MNDLLCVPLATSQLVTVVQALQQVGLPADDVSEPGRSFWRFENPTGEIVGFGGLEFYGSIALLRSVIVVPELQGQGLGQKIVGELLRCAKDMGISEIYLLTTTARTFFEMQGFKVIDRCNVPAEILATRQAAQLCPGSATILAKAISDIS